MMFEQLPSTPIPGSSGIGLERASSSTRNSSDQSMERKRYSWYVKLESESSSLASEDDTESIYSIQGYDTELIQDTPDTDTKSEYSNNSSDVEFEVEYEVDDISGEEENPFGEDDSSSGHEDLLAVAAAGAIALYDESVEAWATDGEDSDNSADDAELTTTDFWTCVQCKSVNNNPLFRYCQKCFQMRKNLFPPRPRGHRKRQDKAEKHKLSVQQRSEDSDSPENVVAEPSSQDSAYGSQEICDLNVAIANTSEAAPSTRGAKRKSSECTSVKSDDESASKKPKTDHVSNTDTNSKNLKETNSSEPIQAKKEEFLKPADVPQQVYPLYEDKVLCIMCENESQNSVFVHTGLGCLCCCYKCAMRTWTTHKKCPMCTKKVKTIIKLNRA